MKLWKKILAGVFGIVIAMILSSVIKSLFGYNELITTPLFFGVLLVSSIIYEKWNKSEERVQ